MDLRLERRKRDMKKYKTTIIITTLITLLPIVIGLFLLEQTSRYTGNTLGKRRNRKRMVQQNIFCLRNAAHPDCDPRFVPFCHFE